MLAISHGGLYGARQEILEMAREIIEKWEKAMYADPNLFLLNEAQCTQLWRNLRRGYDAFAPSSSYLRDAQEKCLHIFIDFYIVVVRGGAIVEMCSSKESWLRAAIFYGDNQRIFQELSVDLQSCVNTAHKLTVSLFSKSPVHTPLKLVDGIVIRHDQADVDFQRDIVRLKTKLEDLVKQPGTGEREKHLAAYLTDRVNYRSEANRHAPGSRDTTLPEPKTFFEIDRQYPAQGDVHRVGGSSNVAVLKVDWLGLRCAKKEFLTEGYFGEDLRSYLKDFRKEVNALQGLNHPNIVRLLCSQSVMPKPSFIMEYVDTSLFEFIKMRRDNNMPMNIVAAVEMMLQMGLGMEYLHGQGVVHRDLKSPNILVTPSRHACLQSMGYAEVKLTDFGLAKVNVFDPKEPTRKMMGTMSWMAPEVIDPKGRIDWRKADTYSFAITCWEILTCKTPQKERMKGGPLLPQECPIYLTEFLKKCWAESPNSRPSFEEIVGVLRGFKMHLLLGTIPQQRKVETSSLNEKIWAFAKSFNPFGQDLLVVEDLEEAEQFQTTITSIASKLRTVKSICDRMIKLREEVKICLVQCNYLIDEYLQAVGKVKSTYDHLDTASKLNLFRSKEKKLQNFIGSLGRLICSMMATEELIRTCGTESQLTALTISAPLPSGRVHSRFGMYLWDLYWNLYVISHVLHIVRSHTSETLPQLLCTNNHWWFKWCDKRDKFVLIRRNTDNDDKDAEDEFLEADVKRQEEDRHHLLANLSNSHVEFLPHDTLQPTLAAFIKEKLLSTSRDPLRGPRLDFATQQDCYVDRVQFVFRKLLKSGTFKRVVECSWLGVNVAVARFQGFVEAPTAEEAFLKEIRILARVQHPCIVHFIGYKADYDEPFIFMELIQGNFHDLIERNKTFYSESPFPLPVTIDILLQIVDAMLHVHECGVLHRDLNPMNILIQPKYRTDQFNMQDSEMDLYYTVKLAGFSSAEEVNPIRPLDSSIKFTGIKGTTPYIAPEVWKNSDEGYTMSVDVWSFGMTAYHIITGSIPFEKQMRRRILAKLADGEKQVSLELGDICPVRLKMLIEKCWAIQPDARPSFEHIRKELWSLKKDHEMNFEYNVMPTAL